MDQIAPGVGHNSAIDPALNPDLLRAQWEQDYADILVRQRALIEALARFHAAHPQGITSDEQQGQAAEFVAQLKACAKAAEQARVAMKAPFAAAASCADVFFKNKISDPLIAAAQAIEGMQTSFARAKAEQERRARLAEAQKRQEEAARAAEAARQAAAEEAQRKAAIVTPTSSLFGQTVAPERQPDTPSIADDLAAKAAIALAQATEAERQAAAPSADLGRSRGGMGAVASLVDNWTFELTDITKVPEKYLQLNEKLVRAEVKALKDRAAIPGIRIFNDPKVRSNAHG